MTGKHVAGRRANRCVHAVGGFGRGAHKARRELVRQQQQKSRHGREGLLPPP